MGASRYIVSLRVWHPSIDPAEITAALGMEPRRALKVGEPRATPRGEPLVGTYRETYWYTDICRGTMPPYDLASNIDRALEGLAVHCAFLHCIRAEGGRIEFFVGWYLRSQAGEVFSYATLAKMGDLGIDLSLDNYYDPDLPDETE